MGSGSTYRIFLLSLLLSFSLALPVCCHADMSELSSHHQEMPAHAAHGQHSDANADSCDCGHELAKDFQKTKKVVPGQTALPLLTGISTHGHGFTIQLFDQPALRRTAVQPGILADAGPPLHLLNSVFLN